MMNDEMMTDGVHAACDRAMLQKNLLPYEKTRALREVQVFSVHC
jgi:hypothetical protein